MLGSAVVEGDPLAAARAVSLNHVSDLDAGFSRIGTAKRFRYVDARGHVVRDRSTLSRIRALAIPPAWTQVWISRDPDGHIQATGRDARGRKQYRYHGKWREVRDQAKYHRLVGFCRVLPQLRAQVARDLACGCLCKRKVLATVVSLMECAQLRVGNDEYTRTNGSYGATTLRDRHARFVGGALELAYRGKSGVDRRIRVTDRTLTKIVRQCRDLPGQRLFQYVEGDEIRTISSADVNDYLRELTGGPYTAKDYRTWAATLGAAMLLCALEQPETAAACKGCIKAVLGAVATRLGHTPTVCRTSYIHPRILDDFTSGALARRLGPQLKRRLGKRSVDVSADTIDVSALRAVETAVARYVDPTRRRKVACAPRRWSGTSPQR
ncbi:DNA topoisomerase IB [soil metagenome]